VSIDLRTLRPRRCGEHETSGFLVSVNDKSAHVTMAAAEVFEALFGKIRSHRQRAFLDGEHVAKTKIKEALGL